MLFFLLALFLLSLLLFALLRVLPGDQALLAAGMNSSKEQVARLRQDWGLDRPYPVQYLTWLVGIFRGDLGTSVLTGESVAAQVGQRSQVTFPLILLSLLIAGLIGVPLGLAGAGARKPLAQEVYRMAAIVAASIPALWSGLLLILLFGRGVGLVGLFPVSGFPDQGWASPDRALASLILPAVSVGILTAASIMRYTRSALLDLAQSDAIAMSMAAGMTRRQALARTGLRLALPELVSVFGLTFAGMVTGVLVVEQLFALPGLSGMLMRDIQNRDLLAAQTEILLLALLFFLVGFLVDVTHSLVDPRLKFGVGDHQEAAG